MYFYTQNFNKKLVSIFQIKKLKLKVTRMTVFYGTLIVIKTVKKFYLK